jgi:uncharacterized repeat protein (TIGR03803 family)
MNSKLSFQASRLFYLFVILIVCNLAWGQKERVVHNFLMNGVDGFQPFSGVVADASGNLYGETEAGGVNFKGTIFELTPPANENGIWSETILYNFTGGVDGENPAYAGVFDKSGNLYGPIGGGSFNCGAIFELSPPATQGGSWSYAIIYSFSLCGGPLSSLAIDDAGTIYGTMPVGITGHGTVFALSPPSRLGGPWTEKNVYSFVGVSDGSEPEAGVTIGKHHELYGTTSGGGTSNYGTVFELTPPSEPNGLWTETTLHSFVGGNNDGANPLASVILDAKGNLYGTTVAGGPLGVGVVFELSPPAVSGDPWTETVLHIFQSSDGATLYVPLVRDRSGTLYGTTYQGGTYNRGVVFALSPPAVKGGSWTLTNLHNFSGGQLGADEGADPFAPLTLGSGGILYGTTSEGGIGNCLTGATFGCGTVFKVTQ